MAAATQGRQVEAIRIAIEYALSAAAGQDVPEPATSDVEDFAAHVRAQGRTEELCAKRAKPAQFDTSALHPTTTLAPARFAHS